MMERRDRLALISEEAAEWFVRVKDGDLTRAEQRRYLRWLRASPAHMAEALRMGQLYGLLRKSKLTGFASQDEISNVIELVARETAAAPPPPPERGGRRYWAILGVICALAALLAVAAIPETSDRTIRTEASEWRHYTLPDGSELSVGARTRLRVDFDEERRSIRLTGGEALFQVPGDPGPPFVVHAGRATARAVGTEFGVSLKDDIALVTVVEGAVTVSQTPSKGTWFHRAPGLQNSRAGPSVAVLAGEQATVPRKGLVTVRRVNVTNELAWAQGRLIFESKTVANAVEEFNSRNLTQIKVADNALGARAVRGVFDATDPESFARFLAKAAQATIVRDTPGLLLIQPAEESHGEMQPLDASTPVQLPNNSEARHADRRLRDPQ